MPTTSTTAVPGSDLSINTDRRGGDTRAGHQVRLHSAHRVMAEKGSNCAGQAKGG
jgi:hypothetical protein